MSAIAAVDMALWDIKGKIAGLPLYQLLGGASREGVMVYGHANGETIDDTIEQALKYRAAGYRAIRLQSGVPGLAKTYGVTKDKGPYEPANATLPQEASWSTVKYLPSVAPLFAAAREALGPHVHLLHDVHHRLTPIEAARLCKDLEPYRPFWVEDAVPAENQANFRLIRQHSTTPLAVGEVFNSIWDCKQLIEEQLIDYIRATIVHAGGITHLRRIASFADLHNVRTGFHGATDLSPVCMAAHCILISRCRTSACRNTWATHPRPCGPSPISTGWRMDTCIRATRPGWEWTSTKPWPRRSPTNQPTCR